MNNSLQHSSELRPTTALVLAGAGAAGNAWQLGLIAGLRYLKTLYLDRAEVTDENIAALARMSELEELSLTYTSVSDEGLARFGKVVSKVPAHRMTDVVDRLLDLYKAQHLADIGQARIAFDGRQAARQGEEKLRIEKRLTAGEAQDANAKLVGVVEKRERRIHRLVGLEEPHELGERRGVGVGIDRGREPRGDRIGGRSQLEPYGGPVAKRARTRRVLVDDAVQERVEAGQVAGLRGYAGQPRQNSDVVRFGIPLQAQAIPLVVVDRLRARGGEESRRRHKEQRCYPSAHRSLPHARTPSSANRSR